MILTSKEKAKKLVEKFKQYTTYNSLNWEEYREDITIENAKQCALICANEVLEYMDADRGYTYWQEVKQEIKKV